MPGYEQIECGLFAYPAVELAKSQLLDDKYWPAYEDGTFIFHQPLRLSFEEIVEKLGEKPIPIIWKAVVLGTKWKVGQIFYAAKKRRSLIIEDKFFVGTATFDSKAKIWVCSSVMQKT